jgi:hypothetical protein
MGGQFSPGFLVVDLIIVRFQAWLTRFPKSIRLCRDRRRLRRIEAHQTTPNKPYSSLGRCFPAY